MKKIIYSLVIMIAAGNLFTSCIEPVVEPGGIKEVREAKAEYLRALGRLRDADAELQKAQAQYVLALAAQGQANAEMIAAQTENQRIQNEILKLEQARVAAENEVKKEQYANAIADLKRQQQLNAKKHEEAMANAEKDLAIAQQALEQALKKIAAEALMLAPGEAAVLATAASNYETALANYNTKAQAVLAAEAALWVAENTNDEYTEAHWADKVAEAQKRLGLAQQTLEDFLAMDTEDQDALAAEINRYKDSVKFYDIALAQLDIEMAKYENQHDLCVAVEAWVDKVDAAVAAIGEAPTTVTPEYLKVNSSKKNIHKVYPWGVNNNDVIEDFKDYVNNYYAAYGSASDNNTTLKNFFDFTNGFGIAASHKDADFILKGTETEVNDGSALVKAKNNVGGLKGILETLKTMYVVSNQNIAAQIEAAEKAQKDAKEAYEKNLAIILEGQGKVEAEAAAARKATIAALETLEEAFADYVLGLNSNMASRADSISLFNAIIGFAKAKDAYMGHQTGDELTWYDNLGRENKTNIADLEFDGLIQHHVSGTVDNANLRVRSLYGAQTEYAVRTFPNPGDYRINNLPADKVNDAFNNILVTLIGENPATSLFNIAGPGTAVNAGNLLAASARIPTGLSFVGDEFVEVDPFVSAPEKAYRAAVCAFWGVAATEYDNVKGYPVVDYYTAGTFAIAKVNNPAGNEVTVNPNLDIIFNQICGTAYPFTGTAYSTTHTYFFGSQLFKLIAADQALAKVTNKDENDAALAALTTIIENLEADFAAIAATFAEKSSAYKTELAAYNKKFTDLTGMKLAYAQAEVADWKTMSDAQKQEYFFDAAKNGDGEYDLGGDMLTWAKEIAPKVPAEIKEFNDRKTDYTHFKGHFETSVNTLNKLFDDLTDIVNGTIEYQFYNAETGKFEKKTITLDETAILNYVSNYQSQVKQIIADMEEQVVKAEDAVKAAEQNLAKFQAGYASSQINVDTAKRDLENAKAELEVAKVRLDTMKAEYDAVVKAIAKKAE